MRFSVLEKSMRTLIAVTTATAMLFLAVAGTMGSMYDHKGAMEVHADCQKHDHGKTNNIRHSETDDHSSGENDCVQKGNCCAAVFSSVAGPSYPMMLTANLSVHAIKLPPGRAPTAPDRPPRFL